MEIKEGRVNLLLSLFGEKEDPKIIEMMSVVLNSVEKVLNKELIFDTYMQDEDEELKKHAIEVYDKFIEDYNRAKRNLEKETKDERLYFLYMILLRNNELNSDFDEFIDRFYPNEDYIFKRHCKEIILSINKAYLEDMEEHIEEYKKKIDSAKPAETELQEEDVKEETKVSEETFEIDKIVKYLENLLSYEIDNNLKCDKEKELINYLNNYIKELPIIKLYILNKINELEQELLKYNILSMDLTKLKPLKTKYDKYKILLEYIIKYQKTISQTEEIKEEKEEGPLSKVIFIPNLKNSTYILQDIIGDIDRKEAAKQEFTKILNNYFLRTKHIKPLKGYEDLYEYYNKKNKVRILFVKKGDIYFASLFFFKKDQKSIKTEGLYDEAIRRFNSKIDYLKNNIDTEDFKIEQQQYIDEIEEILKDKKVVKELKL